MYLGWKRTGTIHQEDPNLWLETAKTVQTTMGNGRPFVQWRTRRLGDVAPYLVWEIIPDISEYLTQMTVASTTH